MIYFVVFATIAWLPLTALSFSFTREPEQPLVVVLNSNSTNIDFRWELSLANGDVLSNILVKRFEKDKGLTSFITLGLYLVGYKSVNTSLYNLDSNVSNGPSSGYVNFTIKDIMKQLNNKDGSKADVQSIDYVYRLEVNMANNLGIQVQVSNVETSVLLKVHNFEGPKNVNTTESEQFNVACSADGKPSPNLMLALPNGVGIKGTGSIDVNLTAYRNMTGMYNCTAENIVSVPQTKSAWLDVWYKPKFAELEVVSDNTSFCVGKLVRLLCTSQAMPPSDYSLYYNDQLVEKRRANGYFDVMLNRTGINTYTCVTNNTVGIRQNRSVHLLVKESPKINSCYVISGSGINGAVIEGERVSLMCNISGGGPFHTTWRKGNKVWTNASLIFEPINHRHAGIYNVMVNDGTDCDRAVETNLMVMVFLFREKITGRFEIRNHQWQDDLKNSDSAAYRNLKSKCMKILEKAYDNIPYVVGKDITKFVKGSVIVEFQLEIIKQISDPLLPLKTLTNKSRGEIDGIRIDIKSIIESKDVTHDCKIEDKQPGNETNNAVVPVLGALLALSVLTIILLIIVEYFRLHRKGSNEKLPIRSNHNAEHSHVNEIPLQESSFKSTGNVSPNEAEEHEPIGRRGLQASNAAIPEYEAVATRKRQAYFPSNKTNDQYNQIQTRNQEGQLPTNTPPIYQETREQPHTYGSLSPFTKLPPKNTLSSSPNQTGEYQSLQQRGVAPHYQSLDDLSKC